MRIFGIRIGVDPSWFLALFLFIWWLTDYYQRPCPAGDDSGAFALATVSALLFFLSILLHELGHAVVAIRNGISIAGIDLWLFGGIAKMSGHVVARRGVPRCDRRPGGDPGDRRFCTGLGIIAAGGARDYWNAVAFDAESTAGAFVAMMSYLASINVLLLVFNMIPAFPLDGGRIARAIAWKVTGDRTRATNFAATIGQGFSYIMIGGGIFIAFQVRLPERDLARLHRDVPGPGGALGDLPDGRAVPDRGSARGGRDGRRARRDPRDHDDP